MLIHNMKFAINIKKVEVPLMDMPERVQNVSLCME
jgi:hypothetical protein